MPEDHRLSSFMCSVVFESRVYQYAGDSMDQSAGLLTTSHYPEHWVGPPIRQRYKMGSFWCGAKQLSFQEYDEHIVGITQSAHILCVKDTNPKTLHNSTFSYFNINFPIKINPE